MPRTKFPEAPRSFAKRVTASGSGMDIHFPYDPGLMMLMRKLLACRPVYDTSSGVKKFSHWHMPVDKPALKVLRANNFAIDPALERETGLVKKATWSPVKVELEFSALRGFQEEGVGFLDYNNARGIIGDEMGLGKTLQTIAWLRHHPEARPALIVSPSSVKFNWQDEIKKFIGEDSTVLSGKKPSRVRGDIFIINYDIIDGWTEYLKKIQFKAMVLDECQYIINRKAKRTKAITTLGKTVPHVIGLSGTPIVNRPVEFFPALHLIAPDRFPSFWSYAHTYCGPKHNGFGWNFNGASNINDLHDKLHGIMIRRLKVEVLPELPAKQRTVVAMDIDNRREYEKAEQDFKKWLREKDPTRAQGKIVALARIEALKQLTIAGKMATAITWIQDFLATGQKLVVFTTHKKTIRDLCAAFPVGTVVVEGDTPAWDRKQREKAFQTDPSIRLFIGNLKAAGAGLNLFAASNTLFLELGWAPGHHDQAEDRVHRIGQKDSVTAWYLIARDTIEQHIMKLLDKKRVVLNKLLDGVDTDEDTLLMELLNQYAEAA